VDLRTNSSGDDPSVMSWFSYTGLVYAGELEHLCRSGDS
jgi:hypothetical protein